MSELAFMRDEQLTPAEEFLVSEIEEMLRNIDGKMDRLRAEIEEMNVRFRKPALTP